MITPYKTQSEKLSDCKLNKKKCNEILTKILNNDMISRKEDFIVIINDLNKGILNEDDLMYIFCVILKNLTEK